MEKALCYKEWIKTRYYYFLAILVSWGMTGYCILKINRAITMKGAPHLWEVMLGKDVVFIDIASAGIAIQDNLDHVIFRNHLAAYRICIRLFAVMALFAEVLCNRTDIQNIADRDSLVYSRNYRISINRMDMPRAHMETQNTQYSYFHSNTPHILFIFCSRIL